MFTLYSPLFMLARRLFAVLFVLISWPVALLPQSRARYGSLLHRFWLKQGHKPVWLMSQENANGVTPETFHLG